MINIDNELFCVKCGESITSKESITQFGLCLRCYVNDFDFMIKNIKNRINLYNDENIHKLISELGVRK